MGSEGTTFKAAAIHDPQFRDGKRSLVLSIPAEGYGDRASGKTKIVVDYVRHYVKP